ncbi:hypothetical protein JKP88DRAFT_253412 [Tribonema minus]|uniref:Uncharacterized protein n=1 Tax=Tribonema minus TaxID=303371 RepID=A0A835ZAK3_9STRA|nr:hypothetical protein JKP88DRAFT_253412 [Tribonema minus]
MAAIAASNAWVLESEARAARVLQRAYRRWKGRRDRGEVLSAGSQLDVCNIKCVAAAPLQCLPNAGHGCCGHEAARSTRTPPFTHSHVARKPMVDTTAVRSAASRTFWQRSESVAIRPLDICCRAMISRSHRCCRAAATGMVRWAWDAQRTAAAAARLRAAAVTLQCWWRGAAARARAGALLHLTIERLCDPATGAEYFFNHNYGTSSNIVLSRPAALTRRAPPPPPLLRRRRRRSWTEPYMPRRARGACAPLQPLPAWSLIVRATGAAYYRHAESGDTADAPPPGHVPCQSCCAALALRRCATDGVALCFACYRREHGDAVDPEGWRHPWTPMAAHLCEVCGKRFAERACVACGNSGGGALSQRSAGSRAASSTASSPRTARAAAARLYCPHCWERAHGAGAPRGHAPLSLLDWAHAQTADRAAEAAAAAARDAQRAALGLSAPPLRGSAALLPRAQRRGTLPIALAPRVAPAVLGGGGGGGGDALAITDGSADAAAPWTESYGGEYNLDVGLLESGARDAAAAAGAPGFASPAGARGGTADYGGADVFGRDGRPMTVIIQ